jgi:hypothetical protein
MNNLEKRRNKEEERKREKNQSKALDTRRPSHGRT